MPRGTNLTQLLVMLRAESGHSVNVSAGADNEASLIQKLQRNQRLLYDDFDWPFMMNDWPIQMNAGQRFYDFPTEVGFPGSTVVNLESTIEMWVDYSGRPVPLPRGIGQREYASTNSLKGDRNSPVRRWDIKRTSDGGEQIEVWPIPADSNSIIYLAGKKKLRPLIAASDVADLDDDLIVLTTSAEILKRQKSADAPDVAAAARAHKIKLQGRTKGDTRQINLARSTSGQSQRGKTIIRIGSQSN
jgi:hypothetical protein